MKMIFYADDDIDDIEIFTEAVAGLSDNIEVVPTSSCEELLENLEKKSTPKPDYIFLDLNMPKKSGRVCLKEIRNNLYLNDTKIIILSTSRSQQDIISTFEDGADYYISKPNTLNGYKEVLSKLFSTPLHTRPSKEEFLIN